MKFNNYTKFFIFLLIQFQCFLLKITSAEASSCCARTAASPLIIAGDDQSQFNFGYSLVTIPNLSEHTDLRQIFRIDGSTLLSDRWQTGVSIPIMQHSVMVATEAESSMDFSDLKLNIAYEFLTSWTYSTWKPQGFAFFLITLPTGRSPYESHKPFTSDVTGLGFFSFSFGTFFLKRGLFWDAFITPEIHYSLPRTFQPPFSFEISPGLGGSIGLGIGYSPKAEALRIGVRIQPRLDQTPRFSYFKYQPNSFQINSEIGFDFSYLINKSSTIMFSYSDQTLTQWSKFPPLSRTIGFNFQHRLER